jgi:hypothetical protein
MPDNVYKFRKIKWADPKRLEMIADFKPKQRGSLQDGFRISLWLVCLSFGLLFFFSDTLCARLQRTGWLL